MPYLDELRERLRLEAGDVILEDWYIDLVTYLEAIEKSGAIDYGGYLHSDIIPDTDNLYNIGLPNLRIKDVYAVGVNSDFVNAEVGNFELNVYVQGKRVLKDEDPIHIASFFDYAKSQIEQAVADALINLGLPPKPKLLGFAYEYVAPDFADIFATDFTAQFDGKVRVKVIGNSDFYAYMKFKNPSFPAEVVALLNEGLPIRAGVWKEMDFTVNKDDQINVRVSPSTRVTILIYNIPEA